MLTRPCRPGAAAVAPLRGLSLVELMVGVAVGLFVVAAAAMLVSTQLNENRRVLLETQVQQDLRATADIITRELRRAGHWPAAERFVWVEGGAAPADNPYSAVELDADDPGQVRFQYYRPPGGTSPDGGYIWQGSLLKTLLGAGGWQELTDGDTLRITSFSVTPQNDAAVDVLVPCSTLCPGGGTDCWPTRRLTVRELVVDIQGEAVADPSVKRRLQSVVRLRNDLVGGPSAACPS